MVYHVQQHRPNLFDFRSEPSTTSNPGSPEEKAAIQIQAGYRGYRLRKKLKEREPKKYRALLEISKKIKRRFKSSGKEKALHMFTPSKNRLARRNM